MSAASYITSVLLSVVLFYVLAAKPLSSQSYVCLNLKEFSVYVSKNTGKVHIRSKDTGHSDELPNVENIFSHQITHISLNELLNIGLVFSSEEFETSVPKEFKCFYMLDDSGKYQLTLGGFLCSGRDYSFLSPEQAAQEELRRERAEEGEQYNVPFIRCISPIHFLKIS